MKLIIVGGSPNEVIKYLTSGTKVSMKKLGKGLIGYTKTPKEWMGLGNCSGKKERRKIMLYIYYRPLNAITPKDRYPLPRIDELIDLLAKFEMFSTLDATSGYY